MLIAAGASLSLMLLARLDHFASMKLGAVELQMRAEQAVAQAYATLDQVRSSALSLSRIVAGTLARSGVYGASMPLQEKLELYRALEQELVRLGVPGQELENIRAPLDHLARHQHAVRLREAATKTIATSSDPSRYPGFVQEYGRLLRFESSFVAPAGEFRRLLAQFSLTNEIIEERIADFDHYEKTGALRDPQGWKLFESEEP
jgi:hypothetical protein